MNEELKKELVESLSSALKQIGFVAFLGEAGGQNEDGTEFTTSGVVTDAPAVLIGALFVAIVIENEVDNHSTADGLANAVTGKIAPLLFANSKSLGGGLHVYF